jgi:hypothetical protein
VRVIGFLMQWLPRANGLNLLRYATDWLIEVNGREGDWRYLK